jgi:2-polyprenyl-6-methoxyphenol hydroxylase-like FAD-dependent oxidoreductase
MNSRLEAIVIGAGIGGLCLAQGLRKAGVDVSVYERDERPGSRWEGYRIHVDPAGARSLRACLPDDLWAAFLATSGPGGDFAFHTTQLSELVVVEESISYPAGQMDPTEGHFAVDRRTLRRLLLAGLDGVVTFGAEYDHYEETEDGRVMAVFADGRRAVGDVLVGADGAGSRVRRQYLPDAEPAAAGVCGVAHKLYLTDQTRSWVPACLQRGMNLVLDDGLVSLFTSVYEPPPGARAALEQVTGGSHEGIDAPYVLCAFTADPAFVQDDLADLDGDDLRQIVDGLIAGWHPNLRRLLRESDPASRSGIVFTASPELPPWPSSHITVLGDAIHTMPATGGLGGNTALRDARLLSRRLADVARGELGLLAAVTDYEAHLREHGYAAVRTALGVRDQMLAHNRLAALGTRAWFRLCRLSRTLRRRTFQNPSDFISAPRAWELTDAA